MLITDPIRKYVNSFSGGGKEVCKVQSVLAIQAVAANVQLVAASTGQRIRVMGLSFTANAAGTNPGIALLDGSGGTVLYAVTIPAVTVGEHARPIADCGYFETSTGTGLFMTITTATANLFVNYILYTP